MLGRKCGVPSRCTCCDDERADRRGSDTSACSPRRTSLAQPGAISTLSGYILRVLWLPREKQRCTGTVASAPNTPIFPAFLLNLSMLVWERDLQVVNAIALEPRRSGFTWF